MFYPTTITTFDEYVSFIERQLGSEVEEDIHLTMDNFKDIITISMKEFYRYCQAEALSTKIYVIEMIHGKEEYKMDELLIYKRDSSSFGEHKLVPVQPNIFNVTDISAINNNSSFMAMGGSGNMEVSYMFYFNGNSGDGMVGMEKVQLALDQMRNADYINKLFQRKYYAEFNRADNILKINPTPRADGYTAITVAEYNSLDKLLNNDLFWKLTIANAKKQWGANFQLWGDISIDGGGKSNLAEIKQEGKDEHAEVKEELEEMRTPLAFFVD